MYKQKQDMGWVVIIVILSLAVVGFTGWVMNIVSLVQADSLDGFEIARAIGIFVAPLGAVLGWF